MIAAMHSGAGKTVTTCAILSALKQRGVHVQAFKCGPDYIDPMFHERVLNVPSRNLDLFLQGEEGVIRTLSRAEADLALIEGAMGYYDGLNNTTDAGAYALARLTKTPAVLAISPGGSGLTLAAQVKGDPCKLFRAPLRLSYTGSGEGDGTARPGIFAAHGGGAL